MYRITISTREHGTILDQDVDGFVLIRKILCEHNDPTHEPEARIDSRGVNGFEQMGLLEWAKTSTTTDWMDELDEGPGLADEPN
ncbi:MAG: hypothetical protein O3B84_03025 [Chloroflexi bacterium]|nr:hypothetical protein [Chloroflexota bacterium]